MQIDTKELIKYAENLEANNVGIIEVSDIKFYNELRDMCIQNTCGQYGTNWMCPPGVGELSDLIAKIRNYKYGLVIQTIYQLEDSFDFEGMIKGKEDHSKIFDRIINDIKSEFNIKDTMLLGAGACKICKRCTYLDKQPCRFPDKAIPSIEACGIDVTALVTSCGIPYNNGSNTVSYIGVILFDRI